MTRFSLDGALAVCAAICTSSWIGSSSFSLRNLSSFGIHPSASCTGFLP
jgi:hypothetical protein